MTANRFATEQPTLVELIAGVATGARDLAAAHAEQLRSEVSAEVARGQAAVVALAIGGMTTFVGIAFVLIALVRALVEFAAWPEWAAWLLVGGIACALGAIVLAYGAALWKSLRGVPDQTLRSIQESMSWISNN
jgi:Putative Actinobacterial Holin-X, holin superfamily III